MPVIRRTPFLLEDVRKELTADLEQEILDFYAREQVYPEEVARKRVKRVICLLRTPDLGHIIGVTSARLVYVDAMQMHFYACRGYVSPDYRQKGYFVRAFRDTVYLLQADFVSGKNTKASGIYISVENPILKKNHNEYIWWGGDKGEIPYVFKAYDPKGNHIRLAFFPGVQLQA